MNWLRVPNAARTDMPPSVGATAVLLGVPPWRGSRSYAPATADDRLVSYTQSSSAPSLQYSAAYTHDARGNRLTRTSNVQGQRSFGYDTFSRMTGATNGTTSVVYTYDALGRKVKRMKGSPNDPYNMQTTRYIYDGLDCIFMLHEDYGGVCPEWVLRGLGVAPGIGNVVATQLGTTAPRYYHPNHRGDTVFITNQQGVQDANLVYDAFGRLIAQSGNVDHMEGISASYMTAVKFRFSSKEWDADAQLYYFGFRWYDPDTGAWTTKDPISFAASDHNLYRLVFNQPLSFVDSYGLWTFQTGFSGTGGGGMGVTFGGGVAFGYSGKYGFQFKFYTLEGAGAYAGAGGSITFDLSWSKNAVTV
jgi:RHS repeat-associated protein